MTFNRKDYDHQYRLEHKQELKEKSRRYYLENKERSKNKTKAWRKENPEKAHKIARKHDQKIRKKIKLEVLSYYAKGTPKCAFCRVDDIDVLCIDHINNDGSKQRKEIKLLGGINFYFWLKRHSFPEGYQVLCWNCNHKKELMRCRNEFF